ncbi:aldehyde dehydrogenase family protein [Pluralibacter gergoviae]|uniref:Aldehyde dehydrogenase family protein n=1 Tax=Pluralibacter gergoviae TaxID=61647 RepID=A0AAI9GJY6_PLUGE|nr:aldehyde dehydrogenase family protein [Pluralibacter gergoviae]EKV0913897.1 aldehyde dehydrogenase family protein [Pluralibacter gergoviae]EKV9906729.1 aldehyde dehydrogenase family protein [Pluralibacter gergoviae]EKW7272236.1 aldehyde dehydrogenase family protein [Pluralibacter gergoviae]ELD4294671.1 aldehyde dehydrogenase family protein [Pluralibacter gergoviae]ELD4305450.1 aldehyde dehydrogenase family protein [Pluralibacter gergoviae]
MPHTTQFYIDGRWADPAAPRWFTVIDPATEQAVSQLALGNEQDVDRAVAAARRAFPTWSETTVAERIALLKRILTGYQRRYEEFATAIHREMGAPMKFARDGQAARGVAHLETLIEVLENFAFEEQRGSTRLRLEPIGVCGLITPWNWPVNQVAVKVLPALAAGCTMVLKPSEYSPFSALLFAEVLHDAGVPAGVFNLVNGDGPGVGAALASHPGIEMVSFTGSTRAGVDVARLAAVGVKRVAQELGGKSANLLLDDVDLENAVTRAVAACFTNSGQSCSIPTRLLVPRARLEEVNAIARRAAIQYRSGPGEDDKPQLGPLVNSTQFERVQQLIQRGSDEQAELVLGGTGRPEGVQQGYYVKPTIFSRVTPDMAIAREEIFGPVLCIMPYDDEDQAIDIANGSDYGLAAYVQSANPERARAIARRLRAGQVHINYPPVDFHAPFGGYRRSGNGREWGEAGLREFLEVKAMVGYYPD